MLRMDRILRWHRPGSKIAMGNPDGQAESCEARSSEGDASRCRPHHQPGPAAQKHIVETNGIEPSTSCLQSRRSTN